MPRESLRRAAPRATLRLTWVPYEMGDFYLFFLIGFSTSSTTKWGLRSYFQGPTTTHHRLIFIIRLRFQIFGIMEGRSTDNSRPEEIRRLPQQIERIPTRWYWICAPISPHIAWLTCCGQLLVSQRRAYRQRNLTDTEGGEEDRERPTKTQTTPIPTQSITT